MILLREEYRGKYRKVFLVQDRSVWAARPPVLGPEDLVLTFDYGLIHDVQASGFKAGILDHVVDPQVMEQLNYDVYKFFAGWHLDADGWDIFVHRDVPFGACFSQEIWNDITYSARVAFCLLALKGLQAESIHCGLRDSIACSFAERFGLAEDLWDTEVPAGATYYFPVFKWMEMMVRPNGLFQQFKICARWGHGFLAGLIQAMSGRDGRIPAAFIQLYFPTIPVIDLAYQEKSLQVYLEGYPGSWFKELMHCTLPVSFVRGRHKVVAEKMLKEWDRRRSAVLIVDGEDIGHEIYTLIKNQISPRLPEYVATVESLSEYFEHRRLDAIVLVANLGMKANILLALGRKKKIPSYLIINGFLSGNYLSEGRNADWINAYGLSIKHHYYHDATNVVCLGDPRMDAYALRIKDRVRERTARPRVVIGAGSYDTINLCGHLCAEFVFLGGALEACQRCKANGREFDITVKVRKNGYISQYHAFCKEFFPGMEIEIVDSVPMIEVLSTADFYISIESQTHFEAAMLGVPSVYYKSYDSIIDPPYDSKSELTTANTVDALYGYFEKFFEGELVGREFMDRSVLEKYIGPLDGNSTRRNLDFILKLVQERR